jgi:hypothetical protein
VSCDPGGHCITCSDEAVEMTVLTVDAAHDLAICVTEDGFRDTIDITLVSPVSPAERLLAHAGTAIAHQRGVL